jgi:hypothetical protein
MDLNSYMKTSMLLFGLIEFFFKMVYSRSSEITSQQKDFVREWLENNNEIM